METQTEQVELRERVVSGTHAEVGSEDHDQSLPEAAQAELQRQRLLAFLSRTEPAWKDEDHPELVELGSYGWVRSMRDKGWRSPVAESFAPEQQ